MSCRSESSTSYESSSAASWLPSTTQPLSRWQAAFWFAAGWLWLASMAWGPTAAYWRQLDWGVYHMAQALLQRAPELANLFATLNLHPTGNLIMDMAFAAVGLPWLWKGGGRAEWARRLALVSYYVVAWRITMSIINRWLFSTVLQWHSASPSLHEAPLVNLRELLPGQNVKVFATGTFPSDHAMQLLFLMLVMWRFGGAWRLPVMAVGLFFCLPRIMSGAHWFSDVSVGGLGVAAVAYGFWFSAPLVHRGVRLFGWCWSILLRVPRPPAPAHSP